MRPEEGKDGAMPAPAGTRVLRPSFGRRARLPAEHQGGRPTQFDELPNEIIPNRLPDFEVRGYGTLYLLRPKTDAALAWVDEHLSPERTMFGDAIVVESRYVSPIVNAIMGAGLEVLFGA